MSLKQLDKLDVFYHRDEYYIGDVGTTHRRRVEGNGAHTILFPFTPDDWWELCTREGSEYMGGCCGNMSLAQDYLNGIYRDGGWVSRLNFHLFIESLKNHDGFEDLTANKAPKKNKHRQSTAPRWDKIIQIWWALKDVPGWWDPDSVSYDVNGKLKEK